MTVEWSRVARPVVLAGAAGIVLALALPGPGWWPLVFAFPGLMLEALNRPMRWWHAAGLGLFAGTVHWMTACHWVIDTLAVYGGFPLVGAWGGLLVMGLFLGLTWIPVAILTVVVKPRWRLVVFPAAWIVAEIARGWAPVQFPWNTTASSLSDVPAALPSVSVWGASGLGWALIAVGTGAWAVGRRSTRRPGAVLGAGAILLALLVTLLAPAAGPGGPSIKVALIQPGTTLDERWDPASWPMTAERVWSLSRAAAAEGPDLVLWPESAMPYRFEGDEVYRQEVSAFARKTGAAVVLNSIGRTAAGGLTNSAFAVRPDGATSRYDKVRLVPFGEYVPRWGRLFLGDSLVREVGAFTPGTKLEPVDAGVPLAVAVCYEIVFADVVASEVREGAQIVATLTNDGWYGTSWALDQHFAQAVLRAVETRRWVVRAALTGISGAIDPSGRVVDRLGPGEVGQMVVAVRPLEGLTPRVRWGEWWLWPCLAMVVVGVIRSRAAGLW